MSDLDDRAHEFPTTPTPAPPARRPPRPGWPELAVGLVVGAVLTIGLTLLVRPHASATVFAVFLMGLGVVAAGGGFVAAVLLRVRSWSAFGLRRTSARWLLLGVGGGVLALALKIPLTAAYVALTGDAGNAQGDWASAAATGVAPLLLSLLFLGILTPVAEEVLFRGVVTTVLLRYGPVVGVVGSAVLFAVIHGVPATMVTAVVVGLIAGELRRRSGSVWPGVVTHLVVNLLSAGVAFIAVPALQ